MWLFAAAYGESVYNNSEVYASTTDAIADSGGSLVDTGFFAATFIIVGLTIITVTVLAQRRRKHTIITARSK